MPMQSISLNIRTQLIISNTQFHTLNTGLQELASLEASPDLQHGQVAGAQRRSTALSTELAEDGESPVN
jgi:hypothetical protein